MLNVQSCNRHAQAHVHASAYVIGTMCSRNYEVRMNNCSVHVAKETICVRALCRLVLDAMGSYHPQRITIWYYDFVVIAQRDAHTLPFRLISHCESVRLANDQKQFTSKDDRFVKYHKLSTATSMHEHLVFQWPKNRICQWVVVQWIDEYQIRSVSERKFAAMDLIQAKKKKKKWK